MTNPSDSELLLDYALGMLEPDQLEAFERRRAADPELASRADLLQRHLDPLLDAGDAPEPPPHLALRTCRRVDQRRQMILDYAPTRVRATWKDLAVAASVLLFGLAFLFPSLQRSRTAAQLAGCTNNLRQIGQALIGYHATHRMFPQMPPGSEGSYAGSVIPMLQQEGYLSDSSVLDCPGNGPNPHLREAVAPATEMIQLLSHSPRSLPCLTDNDYGSNMGYFDHASWSPARAFPGAYLPLVADHPPFVDGGQVVRGNSPNHGGTGQNVVFGDSHVGFFANRRVGNDRDMFLNRLGHTAPGVDLDDHVLAPAIAPLGPTP